MFVDASAIVAILSQEPDSRTLIEAVETAENKASSVVSLFEAVLGLSKTLGIRRALEAVELFIEASDMTVLSVDRTLLPDLAQAHRRFGKGTGHPARLNMGDCYSYALAKRTGTKLLYKGDDFTRTDLA